MASANCARYCGASVDFVDIDADTGNLSLPALEDKLRKAEQANCLPKIVVPVHLSGQPCEMAGIAELAARYGFRVIEDASHAIGGRYRDAPVGNCAYSDITVFSFHPVKIITTGEGGMATCNDAALAESMRLLRSHGVTRDPSLMTAPAHGPWYYEQITLGFNYRMTDLQAALGLSQLQRIDEFIPLRHSVADRYDQALRDLPLKLPRRMEGSYSSLHLYIVRVDTADSPLSHREIFDALRERGIGVNLHYIPVHTQPYYQQQGVEYDSLPESAAYYREAISLPMYHHLGKDQQEQVIAALREVLGQPE